MRTGFRFLWIHILHAGIAFLSAHSPALAQDKPSCTNRDWVTVQKLGAQGQKLTLLCQGELDAAADRRALAQRELMTVIQQAPQSANAYQAHSALSHLYLRIGRFHDAQAQILAMLAARPDAPDLANVRSLFALLGSDPDLKVSSSRPASVQSETIDGNVFMPVVVNSLARSYMVDTGLNISLMSELEAAHLGLTAQFSTTRLSDINGLNGPELRLVEVKNLVIGATHIRNVPFLVVADTNGAFVRVPKDQHAILGIQPLLALGSLGFHTDGTLRVANKAERSIATAPLFFEGELPLTQIDFEDRPLTVTFDTGATQTTINPAFAKLYPQLLRSGSTESHTMNGLSGTTAQRSLSLPNLNFRFGREVHLKPAVILLDQTTGASAWAAANLGYDVMQQARPFTVNFRSMRIEFTKTN